MRGPCLLLSDGGLGAWGMIALGDAVKISSIGTQSPGPGAGGPGVWGLGPRGMGLSPGGVGRGRGN